MQRSAEEDSTVVAGGGPRIALHTVTRAVMSLPKMHWLPKEQWGTPRAGAGSEELSGKAPLAGLFSGFWPSPCLLPDGDGSNSVSLLTSEPAGRSVQSVELACEVELLNNPAAPGLPSPASELSDGSAQAGMPGVKRVEPSDLGKNHGRGTRELAPSRDRGSQRGTGLPGSSKPEQEEEQPGSKALAKRKRDDADDSSPDNPAKQGAPQPSRAETHARSLSRESEEGTDFHNDSNHDEQSRSREPSMVKAGSAQAKNSSRQYSASRSRSACRRDDQWPFRRGRIIPCSTKMSVDMLGNLKFGSDHREDLEGLSPSTAVFLWNYEKQKMHGIFSGTARPVEDTPKHADYLYEVRVKNYAEYPSLPKEVALRLVPRDGKTRRGETLLKAYLDADHVDRLCSAFAK